jgi:hypothetical protein
MLYFQVFDGFFEFILNFYEIIFSSDNKLIVKNCIHGKVLTGEYNVPLILPQK